MELGDLVLIHIYVGPLHLQPFEQAFVKNFRQRYPQAQVLTLDQQSNPALFNAAGELLQSSNQIVAMFDFSLAAGTETIGPVRQLVERMLVVKHKVTVHVTGSHAMLSPMLRFFAQFEP